MSVVKAVQSITRKRIPKDAPKGHYTRKSTAGALQRIRDQSGRFGPKFRKKQLSDKIKAARN